MKPQICVKWSRKSALALSFFAFMIAPASISWAEDSAPTTAGTQAPISIPPEWVIPPGFVASDFIIEDDYVPPPKPGDLQDASDLTWAEWWLYEFVLIYY